MQDAASHGARAVAHQIHGLRRISGLRSMPICAHDGRHLPDLRRDQSQPLFGQPKKVDLNVERIARAEFSEDSARYDIEILKSLEDSSERAGISSGASVDNSLRSTAEAPKVTLVRDGKRFEIRHSGFAARESSIRQAAFADPNSLDAPEPVRHGSPGYWAR